MKKLFFTNPFLNYSEKIIFIVGNLSFVLGTLLAYFSGVRFDGLLDVHQFGEASLWGVFQENAINCLVLIVLLFVFGKIINTKTRMIDIVNAVLVFRIPFYVICLLVKIPFMENFGKKLAQKGTQLNDLHINPLEMISVLMVAMLFLALLGYAIWLLFNGFKTATNCKKPVHYLVFGLLIIVAEAITKLLIQSFTN